MSHTGSGQGSIEGKAKRDLFMRMGYLTVRKNNCKAWLGSRNEGEGLSDGTTNGFNCEQWRGFQCAGVHSGDS
jgi:hypothetical protein